MRGKKEFELTNGMLPLIGKRSELSLRSQRSKAFLGIKERKRSERPFFLSFLSRRTVNVVLVLSAEDSVASIAGEEKQ